MKKVFELLLLGLLISSLFVAVIGCEGVNNEASEKQGEAEEQDGSETEAQGESAEQSGSETETNETIKIGVVVPLSGDMAWAGEAVRAVAEYAVEEVNESGGINGKEVELLFEDDMAASSNAVTAVQKMIDVYDVDAIYGPLFTSSLVAVKDIVNENEVVLIQPTSPTRAYSRMMAISSAWILPRIFL